MSDPQEGTVRDRVLAAAAEVFRDVGYNGATMVRIAVAAGVSFGQVEAEFPDKQALLLEVLDRRDYEADLRLNLDEIHDPQDALEAMVGLVEYNADHPGLVELFTVLVGESVSSSSPANEHFARRYEDRLAILTRTYERGRVAGVLKERIAPADAAAELIALMDGLQIQWLLSGGRTEMTRIVRDHLAQQIAS